MCLRRPISTIFPYTTLFRSGFERALSLNFKGTRGSCLLYKALCQSTLRLDEEAQKTFKAYAVERTAPQRDRKSTRLNSSHLGISYAVFCLKKKKIKQTQH